MCAPLTLSGANIVFVDKTKYLGVMLLAARSFKCSFDHVKINIIDVSMLFTVKLCTLVVN